MKKFFLYPMIMALLVFIVYPSISASGEVAFELNPMGHWDFDEANWVGDCSTLDILDSSGNNRDGTACINGDAPFPVPGKFGNAGQFDGINQYANMGPGFNFTSSFTAAVWIALDDYKSCGPTGKSQHIIGTHHLKTPIGPGRGWGIYWDCDGLAWELTNNTGSAIESYGYIRPNPFPENGSWHHAALVYDSTIPSAALYWDGVQVYSEIGIENVPGALFDNGEPLTVNGLPYAPSAGAPGKIDDTRVYDRALSTAEIQALIGDHPPKALDDSFITNEDISLIIPTPSLLVNDSDPDGDTLSAEKNTGPSNGSLVVDPDGFFTYTPNENFFGVDNFTYIIHDGTGNSDTANVMILVQPVNDPPTAADDTGTSTQGGTLTVSAPGLLANDSDPENDSLSVNPNPVALPSFGSLTLNSDGSYKYVHDGSEATNDIFAYEIVDGNGGSDTAEVQLTITILNQSPVAANDLATTSEDSATIIDVLANDIDADGDTLWVLSVTQGNKGTVTNNGTNVTYSPNADIYGTDIFSYTVSDGNAGVDTAEVSVTINPVNDLPMVSIGAPADGASFNEGTAIDFAGSAFDIEDGELSTGISWRSDLDGVIGMGSAFSITNLSVGVHTVTAVIYDSVAQEGTDQITFTVTAAPTTVDTLPYEEITVAGMAGGDFTDTFVDDGLFESITERESGGKPQNRFSYLEHKWVFNVYPGNTVTLFANAWSGGSADGDIFIFAYSLNDIDYVEIFTVDNTSEDTDIAAFTLPPWIEGTFYLRVTDSDQTTGSRSLDTVHIDNLFIRSETQTGSLPAAPTDLAAASASPTRIDLTWLDHAVDETGFYIERSENGSNWYLIDSVGAEVETFSDTTVLPNTQYYYRVLAYNSSGQSAYSNISVTKTPAGISLAAQGYKVKGVQIVDLTWSGNLGIDYEVYRNGELLSGYVSGSAFTDNIGLKGSGSYLYRVCEAGTSNCSNTVQIDF